MTLKLKPALRPSVSRPPFALAPVAAGLLALGAISPVLAQGAPSAVQVAAADTVVITATRSEARAFDIPASIDRIGSEDIRNGRAQVNISESLGAVPGLLARDRQNYAQDVQISVRGFGARSTFGIRGVRLYVDGIPATLPDGQGQISNVELGSVDRIEVLRGPYSALYGNSSGGVIQVFTEEGKGTPHGSLSVAGGSDNTLRLGVQAGGRVGAFSYTAGVSRFRTDGFRDHSTTLRYLGNVKLNYRPDDNSKLTLVVNSVSLPQAEDPLGLTRAQFQVNPRGVDASALNFNTRKTVNQTQAGLVYERRLSAANSLQAMVYSGHRNTEQYQSIPVATQAAALHPGGLISLGRDYRGGDLRWSYKGGNTALPLQVVAGLSYDELKEVRRGFRNHIGTVLGVKGVLRRDENNAVTATDPYVQASLALSPQFSLNAGVRSSRISFRSRDNFIVGTNPDDSGSAKYSGTLPAVGLMFAASETLHLYATAGKGFETPTLNELSYRANGATGLNFGLKSATSNSYEMGVKARPAGLGEWTAALFQTSTDSEIVTQTNSGGRTTFQNAGATRRQGLELSGVYPVSPNLRLQLAYTLLDASYRDAFLTCTAAPCAAANVTIPSGNKIPGIARTAAYASLGWAPPQGWRAALEVRSLSKVYVNDLNSDAAPAATVTSANVGYVLAAGPVELNTFVRVDNIGNRKTIGSVIVNEGNSRFFEPAPGRTWLASVTASASF